MRGYTIPPATGAATAISNTSLGGVADVGEFGMDFIDGKFRITNSADGNNYVSASAVATATPLNDSASMEAVTGIAFSRTFEGGPSTAYGYNFTTDKLVTIGDIGGSPLDINSGVVKPVAHATLGGVNFTANSSQLGFDIAAPFGHAEQGWLSVTRTVGGTHLFSMDLTTAVLTDLGTIGDGTREFGGLSVQIDAAAPAFSSDGKTATWTDLDGDAVTLKITKGTLTLANFRMLAGTDTTSALSKLTLTETAFTGTNITITAKPGAGGGDGSVNIGAIEAAGVDLGAVSIAGDLIAIDAGTSSGLVSMKSLKAASFVRFGIALKSFTPAQSDRRQHRRDARLQRRRAGRLARDLHRQVAGDRHDRSAIAALLLACAQFARGAQSSGGALSCSMSRSARRWRRGRQSARLCASRLAGSASASVRHRHSRQPDAKGPRVARALEGSRFPFGYWRRLCRAARVLDPFKLLAFCLTLDDPSQSASPSTATHRKPSRMTGSNVPSCAAAPRLGTSRIPAPPRRCRRTPRI